MSDVELHQAHAQEPGDAGDGLQWRRLARIAVLGALPALVFFVLKPERYPLTPNSLDPVFYTGYSLNFDDIMNAVRDRHYFVTRWSLYMPMRVFDAAFGPTAGRLVWRWLLAALVATGVALFVRRRGSGFAHQVLCVVLVLSMPIFVRAFMSDYFESTVVSLGIVLAVVCLDERQNVWTGSLAGGLGALMLVANPFAVFLVGFTIAAALALAGGGLRARAAFIGGGLIAAAAVIGTGWLVFRWRYGIPNVYEPTITFMRTYQGDPAAWKSPRLDWLGRFTWLYIPPVLLVVAALMSWRGRVTWTRVELGALVLCAVQYGFQWYDQFGRNAFGLELSFYWCFMYPPLAMALVVVVRRLTLRSSPVRVVAASAGWVTLLLAFAPFSFHLPAGLMFLVLTVGIVASAGALAAARPFATALVLTAFVGFMQFAAPPYDPSSYFFLNTSPRYDKLFHETNGPTDAIFDEIVWFAGEMDRIPNDASTSFVSAGGWSASIIGIYAPHVTGRWVKDTTPEGHLDALTIREARAGNRPILAVFGDPRQVDAIAANVPSDVGSGRVLLDVTHRRALGYRLVVFELPDSTRLPYTWRGDALLMTPAAVAAGDGSVTIAEPAAAGFVTYGPYRELQPGRYRVTLTYRATSVTDAQVGTFDVAPFGGAAVDATTLPSTAGAEATVSLSFDVSDPAVPWEFRTSWLGRGSFVVVSVQVEAE